MNVSLTPILENYIQAKVESGLYASASEVIRAGLRALREQDLESDIDAGIDKGLADSAAGRVMSSDECFDQLKDKLTRKYS
jgi:antitoxin ParD1/3/4